MILCISFQVAIASDYEKIQVKFDRSSLPNSQSYVNTQSNTFIIFNIRLESINPKLNLSIIYKHNSLIQMLLNRNVLLSIFVLLLQQAAAQPINSKSEKGNYTISLICFFVLKLWLSKNVSNSIYKFTFEKIKLFQINFFDSSINIIITI